jgi:Effector-associated domain 1
MITSGAKRGRLPPGGGRLEKLAAGLAPTVEREGEADLEQLDLPDIVLQWLRPPLEQLGYTIESTWLPPGMTPRPLCYTVAKSGVIELTLIHLPAAFYKPTTVIALAANSLGFVFGQHARLHLCAEEQEKPPAYIDKALKSWQMYGILAMFHAWSVLHTLADETDPAARVVEILKLDVDSAEVFQLNGAQFEALNKSLLERFSRPGPLRRLLREEFDKNLSAISSDAVGIEANVQDVIERAEAEGWIRKLVRVAAEKDPENDELRQVAAELDASANGGVPTPGEP